MKINDVEVEKIDVDHAIEIAPRIWWVGGIREKESFQCHSYLIEQGDNSVLINPGSKLTFSQTLCKINEVTTFSNIRYFICHHQDPEITGALSLISRMVSRKDVMVVSHSRTEIQLKHLDCHLPAYLVDTHNWMLPLEDRLLKFCFTPYVHCPGAFTTYDPVSKVMFSSDIFGGISHGCTLFAKDESYFDCMKPFHQHFMPSNEILLYALSSMEQCEMEMIAPQHGSILRKNLIPQMIKKLKQLDCGLYLLTNEPSDFLKLYNFNETLKNLTRTMTLYRDFRGVASALFDLSRKEIAVSRLEFYVRDKENHLVHYSEKNSYRGVVIEKALPAIQKFFMATGGDVDLYHGSYELVQYKEEGSAHERLHVPLFLPDQDHIGAVIVMILEEKVDAQQIAMLLEHIYVPLQVSIERENMYREMEKEKDNMYQRSIRDPLTGLYTRTYMKDVVQKIVDQQDRNKSPNLVAIMLDIDHFKQINDTWGHNQGDFVLRRLAAKVMEHCRGSDIAIRLGGEEFIIFSQINEPGALQLGERLRQTISLMGWDSPMDGVRVTVSIGIALRIIEESIDSLIARADDALYGAKHKGRNRVCFCQFTEESLFE